jgi:predicted DNA-binding antitoxin AbrB/MazE fold protein
MSTAVEAIYEGGVLRPLVPLPFAEHTRVRVSVESLSATPSEASHRFASADLAGTYELDEMPATNARVREALRQRNERPR